MNEAPKKLDQLPEEAPDVKAKDKVAKASAREEKHDYDKEKQELEIQSGKYELSARKGFGIAIFLLVAAWIAAVLVLVYLSGHEDKPLTIPDGVLIALITGMSVNVIALLAVVIKFLFPPRS